MDINIRFADNSRKSIEDVKNLILLILKDSKFV